MNVNIRKYLLLLLLIFSTSMVKAGDVIMGFGLDIPPYIFQNEDKGIEIDIIAAALAVKGHVLKPLYYPLGRIPLSFRNKSVDAVMGDMGTDLSPFGGFYADPAVSYENVFITLAKSNISIREPKDLDELTIVSFQGADKRYPEWLEKAKSEKRFYGISSQLTQVKLLLLEHYQVVLSDRHIFNYFIKQVMLREGIDNIYVDEHIFTEVDSDNYRPVFRSQQVRDDFNVGLKQIKASGLYQEIYDQYIE